MLSLSFTFPHARSSSARLRQTLFFPHLALNYEDESKKKVGFPLRSMGFFVWIWTLMHARSGNITITPLRGCSLGLSLFGGYPTFLTFLIGCKLDAGWIGGEFFFCLAREAVLATARGEGQTGRTRFVRSLCLLDYMLIELGQCLFVFLSFFGRCGQRALVRTGRTRKDKTTTITTKIGKKCSHQLCRLGRPWSMFMSFCCYFAFPCRLDGIWRPANVANANEGVGRNISWRPEDGYCRRHYD